MLSNATSTAWSKSRIGLRIRPRIGQHPRKGRPTERDAAQTANSTKEKRNENQSDHRVRGRSGQSLALLYRGARLYKEDRFQSGSLSLADYRLTRGAERHGAPAGAEQQPRRQNISAGDLSTEPARDHVLHRRHQRRS